MDIVLNKDNKFAEFTYLSFDSEILLTLDEVGSRLRKNKDIVESRIDNFNKFCSFIKKINKKINSYSAESRFYYIKQVIERRKKNEVKLTYNEIESHLDFANWFFDNEKSIVGLLGTAINKEAFETAKKLRATKNKELNALNNNKKILVAKSRYSVDVKLDVNELLKLEHAINIKVSELSKFSIDEKINNIINSASLKRFLITYKIENNRLSDFEVINNDSENKFYKKEVYLIYGEHNGKAGYVTRQKTLGIVSEALIFSSVFDLNKFMKAVSLKIKFGIIKYELNFKDIVMLDSSMDNKDIIELKAICEKEILDKTLGLTDSSEKNSQKKCSTTLKL